MKSKKGISHRGWRGRAELFGVKRMMGEDVEKDE